MELGWGRATLDLTSHCIVPWSQEIDCTFILPLHSSASCVAREGGRRRDRSNKNRLENRRGLGILYVGPFSDHNPLSGIVQSRRKSKGLE